MLILGYGLAHQDGWAFPLFILLTKFGIASAFNIVYVSHNDVFPVLFAATALGFCNFVTRIFTGISPILAQMEEPLPMLIMFALSVIGATLIWGLRDTDEKIIEEPKLFDINPRKLKKKQSDLAKPE